MERYESLTGWMVVVLVLFALRVLAQFLALFVPVEGLPAFDDWHSATLPYWLLLMSQLLILLFASVFVWRIHTNAMLRRPGWGVVLLVLGWIYWGVMLSRLILGATILSDVHWFAQTLPPLFHLLLANLLMLFGSYHYQEKNI